MQNRHKAIARCKTFFSSKDNFRQFNTNQTGVTNRFGGAERDRTADPLLAKQVLSQLSYSPNLSIDCLPHREWWARADSNCRPHAYQACALTKLSYKPEIKNKTIEICLRPLSHNNITV